LSQTESSIYARQGQEVPTPSYGNSIKNAISKLFGSRPSDERGLSETLVNENVPAVALSEQAEYQSQQDIAAQQADYELNRGVQ
jgi:hypothetical protein